jgi:hypothetical protein
VSLRDVAKFVLAISNKKESQSRTSINNEIVLEYRVNLLRSEVRDLELEMQSLKVNWPNCAQNNITYRLSYVQNNQK